MTKLSSPGTFVDSDSVSKACELLERLGEVFAPENVDYVFADGVNRFLVRYHDVWHAVAFSDTTLLVRRVIELQEDVEQAVYGGACLSSGPVGFK